MNLLDRYVLREMRGPVLLGIFLYSFVLLMNEAFLIARLAFQRDLPGWVLAEIVALQVPRILLMTIPMGLLLGVLIALGRLSADGEITAMRSAGISYLRLAVPVLTVGVTGCLVGLLLYNYVAPGVHAHEERLKNEYSVRSDLNREIRPGVFYDAIPGFVLFADEVVAEDAVWPLRSVFARIEGSQDSAEQILVARRAQLSRDPASGMIVFRADDGELHIFDAKDPASYRVSRFTSPYQQSFLPETATPFLPPQRTDFRDMTPAQLNDYIRQRREKREGIRKTPAEESLHYRRAWLERDKRVAIPVAAIAFALLGLPLGLITARGGRAAGFALSIPVILLFWVTFTITSNLAEGARIPLPLGSWTAIAIIFALGGALILFRQRIEVFSAPEAILGPLRAIAARLPGLRGGVAAGAANPKDASVARDTVLRPDSATRWTASGSVLGRGPMLWPTILDRYIARLYLRSLLLALLSVYTIVWVVHFGSALETLSEEHLPITVLLRYLLYSSPGAAWYIVPISTVVAALVTIGIIERGNEGVAMRAAGISVYRMAMPLLVATIGICGMALLVQERIAPVTNREALRIEDVMEGRTGSVAPGVRWLFGRGGKLYGYTLYGTNPPGFQGLTVIDLSRRWDGVRRRVWADRASWNGSGWAVVSGWQWEWKDGALLSWQPLAGRTLTFSDGPAYFSRREESFLKGSRLPEQMSLAELGEHLQVTRRSGYDTTQLKVAYYARTAFPFTPLVMVLIGLPFAFRMGRKGSLYGIGISFGLVMVYWGLFAVFNALGLEGVVRPVVAAWAPNLLFGMSGAYLLLSVRS